MKISVHMMYNKVKQRLEEPETDLFEAPVCKNKGAKARLYDNTCRCARYFPSYTYDFFFVSRIYHIFHIFMTYMYLFLFHI